MITLTGIRFLIEFSSILVLAFLCIMHEFTDVTLAKQFNIDHASNQANFDDVESASLHLSSDDDKPFVKFTPESLDFGHHPISMPVIETVYFHNRHDEITIHMISISGNTEHFHCSFFEDKVVPPRSNTSFQVAFLARQEGLVNNTLYIHSSVGSFQYRVSALGEASPFRVRPLIGAKVPLNSSFASLIYIYNPFSAPLQLTEMYTSGGGLHLELPDDEYEGPSSLWKVPPYETRPVMKAHFVARIASNHTSYIRIRTNATDVQLMLPVEVEVSSSPGLYSPLDTLDFGVLRSRHDPPKILPIQVINAAMKTVYVQSIIVTPLSEGLSVDFDGPMKLPPRSSSPFHIANLILDPSQFSCTGLCIGKVLIKSKNNQYKLSIPFVVRIIRGELYLESSLSHFFINQSSNSEQRSLTVENQFDTDIVVHDITLPDEAKPYFKLTMQPPNVLPVLLPIGKSFPLLNLEFTPSPQLSHFSTVFRLLTNFSYFDLPLYAYRGRLDLFIPNSSDQTKLDLGLVGLNEQKSTTLVVSNHNPIAIRLVYWHSNLTGVTVEFVGTSQGNITAINHRIEPSSLSRSEATLLQPNHFAVFRIHVNKLSKEGRYNGTVSITTPFETLTVPLLFSVLRGSLKSTKVMLPKTFPGRIVNAFLNVKSNYTSEIKLKGAFIEPKDDRFQIKLGDHMLKPGEDNHIQIIFDASAFCLNRICYSALDIEKEVGHLWLLGSGLYSDTAYIDKELYKLLRNQWLLLSESDRNPAVNVRLQVDGFGSFITEAQAQLYWPRLSHKLSIRFPSIRIGRTITKELMIENPADRPILIQAISVADYPNSDVLLQLISNGIYHQQWSRSDLESIDSAIRTGQNTSAFILANSSSSSSSSANPNRITEWLGVVPNANSYTLSLPPGARQRLAIAFHPLDEKNFTSLLILRNNLTIIEVVMLRGEGGRGLLKIGKSLPNTSNSKLTFEFAERSLERKCRNTVSKTDSGKSSNLQSALSANSLTIKEKFKATNIGRMGMQIRSFLVDGTPCEGYGFHINHCEPIFLMPNQSFDIEIVYSPDFTQPTVSHELSILVDDDPTNAQKFKLIATIPQKLLQTCLNVIPRPPWEDFIYYLLVLMAMFVLFLSIVVAISDAHRITISSSQSNSDEDTRSENNACAQINSENSKKSITTLAENGSALSNKQTAQQQNGLNKVRNRRGNKTTTANVMNSNSSRSVSKSSTISNGHIATQNGSRTDNSSKDEESHDKNGNHSPPLDFADSNSWSNIMRKKLLRQDSSSSEHSQRSSDNCSTSSSKDKESNEFSNRATHRKLAMDSSVESLPQSERAEPNKSKSKEQDKKTLDTSKSVNTSKKNGKNMKQFKSNVVSEKTQKSLEKASSVDVSKCSSESLNFGAKIDLDLTTKARSATLPMLSDSKNAMMTENISISQSDMMSNNMVNEYEIGRISAISRPNNKSSGKLTKMQNFERNDTFYRNTSYRNDFPKINDHDIQESNNFFYDGQMEHGNDIWDLPITNFDSELAMNLLVKQTEEFAAHDDKLSFTRNVPSNRKFPTPPERGNFYGNSVTKLSDDKWEIGEWSNELAKTHVNKPRGYDGQAKFNNSRNNMFSNEFSQPSKHRFGGNSGNNQRFVNKDSFDRTNEPLFGNNMNSMNRPNSSMFKNTNFPIGHSLSKASSNSNSSLASNGSSTFSPVIGRPTPTNSSMAPNVPQTSRPNYNTTSGHFSLNQPIETNFPLMDIFNTPSTSNQQGASESKQNLQSLFSSDAWNKTPLDGFGSTNSFLSSVDPMPKPTSSIFNFDNNESAWSSWSNAFSTSAINHPNKPTPLSQAVDTSTSTFSTSVSEHKLTSSGSSKWPTTTSPPGINAFMPNNNVGLGGAGQFYNAKLSPSPTSANNRVWSPFDPYCNSTQLNPTGISGSTNDQSNATSESSLQSSLFSEATSVFELFGGKSPWSPLGSSVDGPSGQQQCTKQGISSASIMPPQSDSFGDRFPANPSPTSSSSSTNQSSSTSS